LFKVRDKLPVYFIKKVEIKESKLHGFGCFATEKIEKREIFESCPLILFKKHILEDYFESHNHRHMLSDMAMQWENGFVAIMLGYSNIYNHSNDPNAMFRCIFDVKTPRVEFIAKREIELGEEILYHYAPKLGNLVFSESGTAELEDYRASGNLNENSYENWSNSLQKSVKVNEE